MTSLRIVLGAVALALAACSSPYDGPGRSPPEIGAGLTAGRTAGR